MFYKLQDPNPRAYQYAFQDRSFRGYGKTPCPDCGRECFSAEFEGPHCLMTEGGPRYPDYLPFSGAGGPMLLLSERTLEVFRAHGITGIGEVEPVQGPEVVRYRLVGVSGRVDLDLPNMCLKKKRLCSTCGGFEWNRQRMPKLCLDEQTWDGSDICRVTSIPGYVICSEAVVSLVKKEKLKGFAFEPIGSNQV